MFGQDWLVAPVTAENATSWPVYLPWVGSGGSGGGGGDDNGNGRGGREEGNGNDSGGGGFEESVFHWNGTSCGAGGHLGRGGRLQLDPLPAVREA